MSRTSLLEDLVTTMSRVPWWVATAIGGVSFWFFNFFLPMQVSGPMRQAVASLSSVCGYVLLAACLFGALLRFVRRAREYLVYRRQRSIRSARSLSWSDFERLVCEAFRQKGYKALRTPDGPDGGIDILLERDGETTLVQCKQWKRSHIGVKPVRELAGVVAAEKANRGIFVCSGVYTAEAREFAIRSRIELIDGDRLTELLGFGVEPMLPEAEMPRQYDARCPRCGSDLVRRVARRGKHAGSAFLGCSSYPGCRYIREL